MRGGGGTPTRLGRDSMKSRRACPAHALLLDGRMRTTAIWIVGVSLLTGCAMLGEAPSQLGEEDGAGGTIDRDACKIEGDDIGTEGTILRLGPKTITFHDWVAKTGEENEYVGFSITIGGASSVGYVVKAGGERHPSNETTWLHPAGPEGMSNAPGISNVDACEECEDGSCDDGGGDDGGGDGGGGDDGGGDCPEPDGCDGDPGDGPLV